MSVTSTQSTDLLLVESDEAEWDLEISAQDFSLDDTLEMACAISLLTDCRVSSSELGILETDQRGWFGDVVDPGQPDQTGSKLWLLDRAKPTQETLLRAQEYCQEALAWMTEDHVAKSVSVICSFPTTQFLMIQVTIVKPDGGTTSFSFEYAWGQTLKKVS